MFFGFWQYSEKKGATMLKNLITRYGHVFAAVTLLVGQLSANLACSGPFYQPEVPKQLLKD